MKRICALLLLICMIFLPALQQNVYAVGTEDNDVSLKVTAVSSYYNNTAVIASDGTVWAWGDNSYGQLGAGEGIKFSYKPLKIEGMEGAVDVSVGSGYILVLKGDGTVWGIGRNTYGEVNALKDTDKILKPVQLPKLSDITAISAGVNYAMAMNKNGEVYIWGLFKKLTGTSRRYAPELTNSFSGAKAIYALKHNATAIKEDGSAWVFRGSRLVPEALTNIKGYTVISEGIKRTFAADLEGNVWHWGINGTGATKLEGVSGIKDLCDIDGFSTLALDKEGSLWIWDNEKPEPNKVNGIGQVALISAGDKHIAVVKSDGTLWTWGDNRQGQLGIGAGVSEPNPAVIPGIDNVKEISASEKYTLALKNDGTVWAWGDNSYGQLGTGDKESRLFPVKIEGLEDIVSISAGLTHAMALKSDGTLWGWGSNMAGELGDGTNITRLTPVQIKGIDKVIAVSAGNGFTVALRSNRTVWVWGNSGYTRKNDPSTLDRSVPRYVEELDNVKIIDASKEFVAAVRNNNSIWGWGGNNYGQLGSNKTEEDIVISVPKSLGTIGSIQQISTGSGFVLALKSDGKLYAWGRNDYGQLGKGNRQNNSGKTVINDLDKVVSVSAGENHCFALKADGSLWGWGDNSHGQLGIESPGIVESPMLLDHISGVVQIFAGSNHSIALMEDGSLRAWGNNGYGQLGIGRKGMVESNIPVIVKIGE